jgi:hypothetical protein
VVRERERGRSGRFPFVGVSHPVARPLTGAELPDGAQRADERLPGGCCGDKPRRRGTEGFDAGRDFRQRVELSDQASDFFLGAVLGTEQDLAEVLFGEVGAEHQEAGEVELAGGNRVQKYGKTANETGGGDAAKGLVFGVAQLVDAIGVEARADTYPMDTARLDLAEVREQGGEQLIGAADETACGREQLGVGELAG